MTDLKLKDWADADETGTRFPPSRQLCPECQQPALEDNWPPNYGGGSGFYGGESGSCYTSHGSQKFVCILCQIAFRVSFKETVKYVDDGTFLGGEEREREIQVSESVPLVEKDGYLLTPHDVWREDYKEEHGEYPMEAYG